MATTTMTMPKADQGIESAAFCALVSSVFLGAFSLPAGRILLACSLVLLIIRHVRARQLPRVSAVTWLGLLFVLLAIRSTLWGIHPDVGVPRLTKLIWFVGIPVCTVLVTSADRLWTLVRAYVLGSGVLAIKMGVKHVQTARGLVAEGRFDNFGDALVHVGSMTDAQRLMVGMLLALGLLLATRGASVAARCRWGALLGLIAIGLLINFKRGTWFSAAAVVTLFVVIRAGWRYALLVVVLGGALLAVPHVRTRVHDLQNEFRDKGGGRMTMWTQIAPALVREYPWGIGFRSLTNDDMRAIAPEVEPRRDHLHSNPVQALVDCGWIGLGVYLLWMGWACADGLRLYRRYGGGPMAAVALALPMAFGGLLLNGLVEYNFGDAEIVLAYGMLIGGIAAGGRLQVEIGATVQTLPKEQR